MKYNKCPLNYVGGKTKLLPQILPLFPKQINVFYDMFVGGANVLSNIDANEYVGYDINKHVIGLLNMFKNNNIEYLKTEFNEIIKKYGLSKTNESGYYELRNDYNNKHKGNPIYLFMLVAHAFNYQIRFNSKEEFNMPFGKNRSEFTKNMEKNLINFNDFLSKRKISFSVNSFNEVLSNNLNVDDFVYADPPYLNTTAVYNENGGWSTENEKDLHNVLDEIDKIGVKFALSNVNNVNNVILNKWSKKYNIHFLDHNYSNSSYQKKDRNTKSSEILITNY